MENVYRHIAARGMDTVNINVNGGKYGEINRKE